jgi:hypothetical protein
MTVGRDRWAYLLRVFIVDGKIDLANIGHKYVHRCDDNHHKSSDSGRFTIRKALKLQEHKMYNAKVSISHQTNIYYF